MTAKQRKNSKDSLRSLHAARKDVPTFLAISAVALIAGLALPLFKTTQLIVKRDEYSILTGIWVLVEEGEWFLGAILFLFSVIFPIVKIAAMGWIWMVDLTDEARLKALEWLGFLGKWSMLDVFVVALTIVAVKLGPIANVEPKIGVYVFCSAIFCSMIATMRINQLAKPKN